MNLQLWSWMLTVVGVTTLFLTLRHSPWGWVLGVCAQVLWFSYGTATKQWGFLVSSLAYGSIYVVNYRRWRADLAAWRRRREPQPEKAEEPQHSAAGA